VEVQTSVFQPNPFGSCLKNKSFYLHRTLSQINLKNLKIQSLSLFKNSKTRFRNKFIIQGNNGDEHA